MILKITNKKGQEEGGSFSTAVWLAVLVLAIIIIVPLIYREQAFASELSENTACYTSIAGMIGSSGETGAKCPIKYYTAYNSRITETKEGKTTDTNIVKDFSAGENKVNELFAKLMGNCLQEGGGVRSKAFGRNWLSSTACLECSNINFDKDTAKDSFGDLRKYLEENNAPGKIKKYVELFTKDENAKNDWIDYGKGNNILPGKYENIILKNNIYTIFFIGIKSGTIANAANKKLFGDDTYFVYAATQENFNKVCERKVN